MTMDDVEIVEFPYPDDWYSEPRDAGAPDQSDRHLGQA